MHEGTGAEEQVGLFWQIAIPAVPLLLLVAHFVWPDLLALKLLAIGLVLALLSIPVQALHAAIVAGDLRGEHEFTLHFGVTAMVTLVGVVLAVWWGWIAAGVVFTAYLLLVVLSAVVYRVFG
jgi:hypothetical protein